MVTSCEVRKFAEVPMIFGGYRGVQLEGAVTVVRGCRIRSNGYQKVLLKGAIAAVDGYRICSDGYRKVLLEDAVAATASIYRLETQTLAKSRGR